MYPQGAGWGGRKRPGDSQGFGPELPAESRQQRQDREGAGKLPVTIPVVVTTGRPQGGWAAGPAGGRLSIWTI